MNRPIRYRTICTLAVVAAVPVGAKAQDFAEAEYTEPSPASQYSSAQYPLEGDLLVRPAVDPEQKVRRELEALEVATARKREELERRLQQVQRQRERALAEAQRAHRAADAANSLLALSPPEQRWLIGVKVSPSSKEGVKVEYLMPEMPAAEAGIEVGDLIVSVNGIRVREVKNLNAIINAAADQELTFQIRRGGEQIEKSLEPAPQPTRPQPEAQGLGLFEPDSSNSPWTRELRPPAASRLLRPEAVPRYFELRPSPNANANPDTAELGALKREIAELRELVQDVAESLSEGDEGVSEASDESAEGDEEG